ncbi:MAG: sulfatase [Limisphaerales bacterium]
MRNLVLYSLLSLSLVASAARKPNVIVLLADDLGWSSLGCCGNTLHETPNLDRLAQEGMRFTDAYAACTVCSPTRASLLTGKYPARLHLTDFIAGQHRPFEKLTIPQWTKHLPPGETTIAEVLKEQGYATAHVGKWHLEAKAPVAGHTPDDFQPTNQGFDISIDKPAGSRGYFLPKSFRRADGGQGGFATDYLTDEALKVIESQRRNPFFLYFAYHNPHTPIQAKEELVKYYEKKLASRPDIKIRNATYAAMIHSLDESVGRIAAKVDELGLGKDTLILFVSDNGGLTQRYGRIDNIADNRPLRRGKGSAYEGGVRVPMIARWTGMVLAATTCCEPVMTIDFLPTIAKEAGASHEAVDGVSFGGLLRDATGNLSGRRLYWHYPHYHAGGDAPYSAIRDGHWRFLDFHDDTPDALYDLASDLGESENLILKRKSVAKRLRTELLDWRNSVHAQMPTKNAAHDPEKAGKAIKRPRRR